MVKYKFVDSNQKRYITLTRSDNFKEFDFEKFIKKCKLQGWNVKQGYVDEEIIVGDLKESD